MFENSSRTSETNAGSLKYNNNNNNNNNTGKPINDKLEGSAVKKMINMEARTGSTGDFYQDISKKPINIRQERVKNIS